MKILVDKTLGFEVVSGFLGEAQTKLDGLSIFERDEIVKIVENLAATEPELAVAMGSIVENIQLNEFMVKHVDAKGTVTKTKDRKTRSKLAFQTTGLSKSERRRIARKAVKTKKANPSTQIRASKKKKRAMAKRKMLGLS